VRPKKRGEEEEKDGVKESGANLIGLGKKSPAKAAQHVTLNGGHPKKRKR